MQSPRQLFKTLETVPPPPSHLLTPRLILLPTPHAISHPTYISLYASLHSSTLFCTTAFGTHWLPRDWSLEECQEVVRREIRSSWEKKRVGDFAVGLRKEVGEKTMETEWIGYVGIRDGHLSMPENDSLPDFLDLVEVRYGFHPSHWGHGYAPEALKRVMEWGQEERGIRRFVAETEKENERSGRVLVKGGFRECKTNYWQRASQLEWECTSATKFATD